MVPEAAGVISFWSSFSRMFFSFAIMRRDAMTSSVLKPTEGPNPNNVTTLAMVSTTYKSTSTKGPLNLSVRLRQDAPRVQNRRVK